MPEIRNGQRWRHKKRGTTYEIVDDNAMFQCAIVPALTEFEDQRWVAYQDVTRFGIIFRLYEEFLDGRFELVSEAE